MPQSGGAAPAEEIGPCLCQRAYQTEVDVALSPGAPGLWTNDSAELYSTVTVAHFLTVALPWSLCIIHCPHPSLCTGVADNSSIHCVPGLFR